MMAAKKEEGTSGKDAGSKGSAGKAAGGAASRSATGGASKGGAKTASAGAARGGGETGGKSTGRAKKAATGGEGGTRAPRGGLAQKVTPDAALASVIGAGETTRAEVTKKIWEYVRKENLQVENDRRTIRADSRLKPIFGGKESVSMFEMTKLVSQHLK
jgi:upstream activation factor subunit UAF30